MSLEATLYHNPKGKTRRLFSVEDTALHDPATNVGRVASLRELMDAGGWSDTPTAISYQRPDIERLAGTGGGGNDGKVQ